MIIKLRNFRENPVNLSNQVNPSSGKLEMTRGVANFNQKKYPNRINSFPPPALQHGGERLLFWSREPVAMRQGQLEETAGFSQSSLPYRARLAFPLPLPQSVTPLPGEET